MEIWARASEVINGALAKADLTAADLAAVGITNQRETTVVWDKRTGKPVYNALVWQDTRTDGHLRRAGRGRRPGPLPPEDRPAARDLLLGPEGQVDPRQRRGRPRRAEAGDLLFGNIDTWCIWNLTGGVDGGVPRHRRVEREPHDADEPRRPSTGTTRSLALMGVPRSMLPPIQASSRGLRRGASATSPASRSPATSATSRPPCSARPASRPARPRTPTARAASCSSTRAPKPVPSKSGLLTTLGYKIGDQPAVYALEGSIAITGALVQWLRDNLGLIAKSAEIEALAATVEDNGGIYFVPAFSGLFAPYWQERRPRRDRGPDPLRQQGPHRPGRRSRRPPGRPARCSTR